MIHHIVTRINEASKEGEAVTLTPEEVAELAPFVQAAHQAAIISLEAVEFRQKYRMPEPQVFADRMEGAIGKVLEADLGGEAGAKALAAELGMTSLVG